MRSLEVEKVLMGGPAALSITEPPPTVSLFISHFSPRPHQPTQIGLSNPPDSLHTLRLRMAFINIDAIEFLWATLLKAGPRGEKRPSAFNGNVFAFSEQCDSDSALQSGNQWSGRLQDCDLIEVLNMTTPSFNKPLDLFGKLGADVEPTGASAEGRSSHFIIRTMVDDFADMVKELGINRGRRRIDSDISQDLSSLEEMLFGVKEMQESQRAGGSGNLTGSSDDSVDLAVENNWKGSFSPKSRRDKSKGEYISSICRWTPCW